MIISSDRVVVLYIFLSAGCSDIRFEVNKGFTQTARTGSNGQPPFKAGDIVKFRCDEGYTMRGYSTVTCSGKVVIRFNAAFIIFLYFLLLDHGNGLSCQRTAALRSSI